MKSGIFKIDKFLGVNESPDGDTGLKMGEAASMMNFRITKEWNLQLRPGYNDVTTLADGHPVRGMWVGYVAGVRRWLAACNGHLYSIHFTTKAATDLGTLNDAATTFFPFNNKVYIMNGSQYKSWDGTTLADVTGYVPVTYVGCTPDFATYTPLQQINKLIASQWIYYSGNNSDTVFQLPLTSISSVDSVVVGGETKTVTTHYTVDLSAGTVTFTGGNTPPAGTNNVQIKFTKTTAATNANRALILAQKFSEAYNGYTDNRIFLYGDGTNKAYYSDFEYSTGLPSAEYFPDLNVLNVGEQNTPITSMVRHYDKLTTFKSDSTWLTYGDFLILYDGTTAYGLYTRQIDREIGNEAYGQVRLINNYPISLFGNSAYRWGLIYSSGTQDERAAKRISDKVSTTLDGFTFSTAITFDDEYNREFWIVNSDGDACIYQYANEADTNTSYKNNPWYIYDNINAACFVSIDGELYFGSKNGHIMHLSRNYRNDNGTKITASWESGSMAFDAEYMRKLISKSYVSLLPESGARVTMTFETDRKSDFDDKEIAANLSSFLNMDFSQFSFITNRKPQITRVKLKAKKFVYLKLKFKSDSTSATATILSVDLPIVYTGLAK